MVMVRETHIPKAPTCCGTEQRAPRCTPRTKRAETAPGTLKTKQKHVPFLRDQAKTMSVRIAVLLLAVLVASAVATNEKGQKFLDENKNKPGA
jgi:hypothetical protein